jgi:hypothetical protein
LTKLAGHAFFPADRREAWIKRADRRVADLARDIAETKLSRRL